MPLPRAQLCRCWAAQPSLEAWDVVPHREVRVVALENVAAGERRLDLIRPEVGRLLVREWQPVPACVEVDRQRELDGPPVHFERLVEAVAQIELEHLDGAHACDVAKPASEARKVV